MKKFTRTPVFAALAVLALTVLMLCFGLGAVKFANASASDGSRARGTYLTEYYVEMDIKSNRSIAVTEEITVSFAGNSGFIRDIPVNAGEQVKHVNVKEVLGNTTTYVFYDVFIEDTRFLSIDIGDSSYKYDEHTYRITYEYCLTKAPEGDNMLALTPVGGGWDCDIENVSIKLILPEGYKAGSADCFTQDRLGDTVLTHNTSERVENGRTVVESYSISLNGKASQSLRVDLTFDEGALTTYFDFTPYWFGIAGVILLLIAVGIKIMFFNKHMLIPVVNFEAPQNMDPLLMGKLIDNNVNPEDITSMIFYWADKGYLKINFGDPKNPTIIRLVQSLPDNTPPYEVILFFEMFSGKDAIKPTELQNKFYLTINKAKKLVERQTQGLYERKSVITSVIFVALSAILLGLAPLLLAMTQISASFLSIGGFFSIVPLAFIYIVCLSIKYNALKTKAGAKIGIALVAAVISALLTVIYVFFVSSTLMNFWAKILLSVIACAIAALSVLIVSRSKSYTEQLNQIVGFKKFIELAEKDRLEKMLEEDPQFYYHILPYAQVLGVSKIWEDKFKQITVEPPQWAVSSTPILDFIILNRIMNVSMSHIKTNMVSRPSSSGLSGGGRSSFGGHSGGGHGGGGGRFR